MQQVDAARRSRRTRSTASASSSPAAWAWQVSKQKPSSIAASAAVDRVPEPREGVESPGDRVLAAGGVLDADRDLGLEHLERAQPAADALGDAVLGVPGVDDHRGRADVGRGVAGLLQDLARAVADVVASASRR